MSSRRKDEVEEPFDYEEEHTRLVEDMCSLHISRVNEMPRIDLYLDQVLEIVSTELAPLYAPGEKVVTGSMVNNYVKQRVMPAPNRKRYTRNHLAYLLLVCCLKPVLTIAQIAQLLELCGRSGLEISHTYNVLVKTLEDALSRRFGSSAHDGSPEGLHLRLVDQSGEPVTGELPILLEHTIDLVANKAYVDKVLNLEERRAKTMPHEPVTQPPED